MPQKPSQSYSDGHSYIPPHVQEAMTKQMEHMAPAHMKQYAGAFVQQQMNQGRGAPQPGRVSGPPPNYRPVTHLPRKDHFHQYKAQQPSRADTFLPADQTPGAQVQPDVPQQPPYPDQQYQQPRPQQPYQQAPANYQPPNAAPSDYDFFMNSQAPQPKGFSLPGRSSSLPIRIGLITGGLVVLLILFNVVKGLLAGPSNYPYYLSVIQDQQEIAHLSENALGEDDLSTAHKNFAATSQISVKSAQSDLVNLLITNGKKVDGKQANLKVSAKTDTRLTTAASSGTYNTVFNEVMLEQLNAYRNDLQLVASKATGSTSRNLLKSQLHQVDLLITQLNDAKSGGFN